MFKVESENDNQSSYFYYKLLKQNPFILSGLARDKHKKSYDPKVMAIILNIVHFFIKLLGIFEQISI